VGKSEQGRGEKSKRDLGMHTFPLFNVSARATGRATFSL
jgi:hypothetical protein